MRILSWVIALLGLWEAGDIAAPFVMGLGEVRTFVWNHIVVGLILIVVGIRAATTNDVGVARTMSWIAVAAGLWLVAASFILGNPQVEVGLWNDIAVGVIVVVLSSAPELLRRRQG